MKTLTHWIATTVLIGSGLAFTAHAAESPSVLLQKGIYAEETEGNVDAAIKIYEQIAAEAATNRAVLAQAQYRLAVCYQKKGNKEQAIKLLNELVRQFPAETGLRSQARKTLADLGQAPAQEVAVRNISLSAQARGMWSVSPDGRFLAFSPRDRTLDLAVYEFSTGKSWTILSGTNEKSVWSSVVFSPDSQWIAYDISQATLHVTRIDGSETRQLAARADEKEWLEVSGWSADGTQVVADATSDDSHANRVFTLNARTGAVTKIAALPVIEKQTWFWLSPDARYLAQRKGTEPKSVTLVDLKTNREETISESDGERVVGWAPDGSHLIYTRKRKDTIDLWSRLVTEGKPVGEPELVWSNLGHVMPLGITRDGNIYYYIRPAKNGPNPTDFATLWVMEGFLSRAVVPAPPARRSTSIPLAEVTGPNGAFVDPKCGFTAVPPAGLRLDAAFRSTNGPTPIVGGRFYFQGDKESEVRVAFHYREPGPVPNAKDPAALRAAVASEFDGVQGQFGGAGYTIRPDTLAVRTVDGHSALCWVADFTRGGEKGVHVMTGIYYDHGLGFVWMACATAKESNLRPIYDDLLKTVRLPPASTPN